MHLKSCNIVLVQVAVFHKKYSLEPKFEETK